MVSNAAKNKAKEVAKKVRKGGRNKVVKVRTTTRFSRPKTATKARAPTYTRKSIPKMPELHKWQVILNPLATQTAMKCMEDNNTLVMLVDIRANKFQIKKAFQERFGAKPIKVNTLIRPDGKKKAFIKLSQDADALDIAAKIGVVEKKNEC